MQKENGGSPAGRDTEEISDRTAARILKLEFAVQDVPMPDGKLSSSDRGRQPGGLALKADPSLLFADTPPSRSGIIRIGYGLGMDVPELNGFLEKK